MTNLALNRLAPQSSTSQWSSSLLPAEDARGANDGVISGDMAFHTGMEPQPWWQVELAREVVVRSVAIFNARSEAHRLRHFTILGSRDGTTWRELFRKTDDAVFGASDAAPFTAVIRGDHLARFVRVRLDGYSCLHFNECQVFR